MRRRLQQFLAANNPPDIVRIDIPTLIRILEWSREDAPNDAALHMLTENLIKLAASGKTISMSDYTTILKGTEPK